ncbi:MAG: 50S ribosomal protein L22 [Deltaproteobacteria bacterium]|nr:50S ribosomal protein L22 [Deltaproteobacteria bacterium]
MDWEANLRHSRISARKARLVADLVRGMKVDSALDLLRFTPKKGAKIIRKVVQSALDNASRSAGVDEDRLYISRITVDEGPTLKRWSPRAMGRATRIRKRTSHICVAVTEG